MFIGVACIGIEENTMETTIVHRGNIEIMARTNRNYHNRAVSSLGFGVQRQKYAITARNLGPANHTHQKSFLTACEIPLKKKKTCILNRLNARV